MARILFVASRLPFPPREGHQLRSWHLLKALAARHEVALLGFARRDDDIDAADRLRQRLAAVETFRIASEHSRVAMLAALARSLLARQPFVATKYTAPALRARIAERARNADAVHFDMLPLMQYADVVPAGIPVVYNAHNVEHALLDARAQMQSNRLLARFLHAQAARLRQFERAACERADRVLACSDADADALRRLAPRARIEVVANGVDLDANRPAAPAGDAGAKLVFVGQMGWFPNRDGVEWFLREVFPRILAARTDAQFVLVGKSGGLQVPENLQANVTVAGFVPDLRPLVQAANVYVVPLRAGSGTRLKVLEAMALGKAIVTTSIGSEGIALRHDESALYADSAEAFADAVLALLAEPERAHHLGAAARACAERHYGWDAIGNGLLRCYDELLPARPPRPHCTARDIETPA